MYVLVSKKGRCVQMILDLHALNKYIGQVHYIDTYTALICFVCPGDWFPSTDLKGDSFSHPYSSFPEKVSDLRISGAFV